MGVEAIISILIASAAAVATFYTSVFQRRELRGKTRAEQDAISTKASNEALAVIQGGLGKEVTRLGVQVEGLQKEVDALQKELAETKAALEEMAGHRDDLLEELQRNAP